VAAGSAGLAVEASVPNDPWTEPVAGLTATVLGPDHARSVMEWETMQGTAILRVGAAVALAAGIFMAFALTGRRRGVAG